MPVALITGVCGQDGSYLAEFLLSKDYRVVGIVSSRTVDQSHISHLHGKIEILKVDILDRGLVKDLLLEFKPDEIYNLAARASSTGLWTNPVLTGEVNGLAVQCMLEAIRIVDRRIRFFQASSSEVFGNSLVAPQTENTSFAPRNPYGVAKAYSQWSTTIYRDYQGLYACCGILYNHESPRRGLEFVTRKISHTVARISLGQCKELRLGNLDAKRDWGFAGDFVRAMWMMLQQPIATDYIVATGEPHSVREFCEIAFSHLGLKYQDFVVHDPESFRSPEVAQLVGNPAKAMRLLGWKPTMTFRELVIMMVENDLELAQHMPEESTSMTSAMCEVSQKSKAHPLGDA